ncbi:MAG: hypothetical protein M3Z15_02645 [Pseudomonadota bacterium]|nr:hypothetical protein [Pseudomonadota bacterium]
MSGRARVAVGLFLVAMSLAAGSATPARNASAPARTPAAAAAPASAAAPAAAAASAPVEFIGTLEVGATYVAEMAFDTRALHIWRPVKEVRVAKNVAWTIDWSNIDQFPQLKSAATQARPQQFRFRVVKNDVVSGSPVMPWMSTYRCEILAVEPVAVAGPSKAAPKKR